MTNSEKSVPLLSLEDVSFSYGKGETVLDGISFEVPKADLISVVGTNGSGKTTLFNLLTGLKKPKSGKVLFEGKNIGALSPKERAKMFSVISQGSSLNFPFSCIELVIFGLSPFMGRFEKLSEDDFEKVREAMEITDTYRFASKNFSQLSGGERQRVFLARAIVGSPKIIFLDEAMSELDIASKIKMMKLLKNYAKEKNATIFEVSHDLSLSYKFSDFLISMKGGKVTATGEPEKVINEQFFRENFSVEAEVIPKKGFFINREIN